MCRRPRSSPSPSTPTSPRAASSLISSNLPGLPPVTLAFNGAGALDNFDAKLDFTAGPERLGAGRRHRGAAGRGAEAHARPQFPASKAWRPRSSAPFSRARRRSRAMSSSATISTIATPGLHLVSANARLDFVGGRSADNIARRQDPRRRDSGRDRDRQARPQRLDRRAGLEPDDRRRVQRRRHPCRAGLARQCLGDLPRRPQRLARRRVDADRLRGSGRDERPCARRPDAGPRHRQRGEARLARIGFDRRRRLLRYARSFLA